MRPSLAIAPILLVGGGVAHGERPSVVITMAMAMVITTVCAVAGRRTDRWFGRLDRDEAGQWSRAFSPAELRIAWAFVSAVTATAVAGVVSAVHAALLDGAGPSQAVSHGVIDGGASLVATVPFYVAIAAFTSDGPGHALVADFRHVVASGLRTVRTGRGARSRRLGAVCTAAMLSGAVVATGVATAPTTASAAPASCNSTTVNRTYDVSAINVVVPHNRWGSNNPDGMVYVLERDRRAMVNWSRTLDRDASRDPAGNRRVRPRPLVLRANEGECVQVNFTNRLSAKQAQGIPASPRASMHVFGASYNAATSDGSLVGFNADTTVPIGKSISYYWRAPSTEGLYMFRDMATPAGGVHDGGSAAHGLYGALAVEPARSTWLDPETGTPLYTGTLRSGDMYLDAVVVSPQGQQFRESVQLSQDELPNDAGFAFNYGAEPEHLRDEHLCPDCTGEETSLSSWPYGDPALVKLASGLGPWLPPAPSTVGGPTPRQEDCGLPQSCWTANVFHTYANDPTKIRFGHAGVYETHVFHLHAHQWLADPKDVGNNGVNPTSPTSANPPQSNTVDSQTYGPWEAFTADLLFGSGSKPGTVGDSIFHCHLYPHFAAGFWALLRTHDVLENGSGSTPDGIGVRALVPLATQAAPPAPTAANPGYPRFVPGAVGWRAPQPPLGITNGPDGPDEPRIVAGKVLTEAQTKVEAAVQATLLGGRPARRGAPFRDPCPAGTREVTFNVSAIQLDIVYNDSGWHDTQGRILVPDADVAAVRAGTKTPEPLYFRVNQGDCVNFRLTNLLPSWLGNDAFLELVNTSMIGQHIHLVKFDVLASDGSSNGWNYQQAAFTGGLRTFNQQVVAGRQKCSVSAGCRMPRPSAWNPNSPPNNEVGQTIHARWFADYELRTVFTHDHHFAAVAQNRGVFGAMVVEPAGFDTRHPRTGVYLQPINDPIHGAVCARACLGNSFGTAVDIIGPGTKDDFREFGIAVQDYTSLTRPGGDASNPNDTIEPPAAPEIVPAEDPGVMAINFRNEPIVERLEVNGTAVDPSTWFSSYTHGDPSTPIFQAYGEDSVRIRLVQGAQEEQHNFEVHGVRWKQEPNDPESNIVASQALGISEAFTFEVPNLLSQCNNDGRMCQVDLLYGGTNLEDRYLGAWGIIRAFGGKHNALMPLPDNTPSRALSVSNTNAGAQKVSALTSMGSAPPINPCPSGAPVKSFDVSAFERPMTYNMRGLNDPYGLMYGLDADVAAIRLGTRPAEPLTIRVNEGDCVKVKLTNRLTTNFRKHAGVLDGDAPLATEPGGGTPAGLTVGLHPQLLTYDPRSGDGANVGWNLDQLVQPGQSRTYIWYADDLPLGELGMVNLTDFGDFRGHRHHGLQAALIVEPAGATFVDPRTGAALTSGAAADIRFADPSRNFREHVIVYQNGLTLRDAAGNHITDPVNGLDKEDQGEVGISYRSEPFFQRIGHRTWGDPLPSNTSNELTSVMSSVLHGDPATPIIRAYVGDRLRLRVTGGERGRQNALEISGHSWAANPLDPGSRWVGVQGGISYGSATNIELIAADGGGAAGDYRYGDVFGNENISGGSWGIFRIYPRPTTATVTPLTNPDSPYGASRPLRRIDL